MAREEASAATPALTADGIERLCGRAAEAGGVVVQVLGVYRCKARAVAAATGEAMGVTRVPFVLLQMRWTRRSRRGSGPRWRSRWSATRSTCS
jgi:hypothetical protein